MKLIELKKSLHERIDDVTDEHVLEQVAAILNHTEKVFIIPEYMKEGVKQGIENGKNGRVFSQEDFDKKYEEWLKK